MDVQSMKEAAAGTLSAELDLSISRSLLSQPEVDGTIRIGDTEYVVWARQDYGFFESIQRKFEGELDIPVFADQDDFGHGTELMLSGLLWLHSIQYMEQPHGGFIRQRRCFHGIQKVWK